MRKFNNLGPKKKAFSQALLKLKASYWSKGLILCMQQDERMQIESEGWPDGFTFELAIYPSKTLIKFYKVHSCLYLSQDDPCECSSDVSLQFKSFQGVYEVLSGKLNIKQALNEGVFWLTGDYHQSIKVLSLISRYESIFIFRSSSRRRRQKSLSISPIKAYRIILFSRGLGKEA